MRVLMLVSEAPPINSGIARVAGELTERLRARGVTVDVLSANEIPRWTFGEFRFSSLALRWPKIQAKLSSYDILHVHGTVPTFSDLGLLLGRLGLAYSRPSTAIVYTHHSDIDIAGLEIPAAIYNRVHTSLLWLADHIVASTPTYASLLEDCLGPGRVSAVRFGVDAEHFQSKVHKARRFTVLFVGQLRPYKGVDVLLRAWQHVDNADLHILGDGHQRADLEALASKLKLQSVHFHGAVTEKQLKKFYARSHVLVLPSTRKAEAFGLVLLEGMAAGCVPVATNLPGVSDVVSASGFTFPVGDSAALAEILIKLRDNRQLRRDLAELATARSLATDWDYTADAYYGIYRQAYLGRQLHRMLQKEKHPAVLQKWLHKVAKTAGADRASLMLVAPKSRKLRIVAGVGLPPHVLTSTRLPLGHRMAGYVAHTGKPMFVRKRAMHGVARIFVRKDSDLTSAVILPVHYGKRQVGVLNLARGPQRLSFTAADMSWLGKLTLQVAPLLFELQDSGKFWRALREDVWTRLPRTEVRELPATRTIAPLHDTGDLVEASTTSLAHGDREAPGLLTVPPAPTPPVPAAPPDGTRRPLEVPAGSYPDVGAGVPSYNIAAG